VVVVDALRADHTSAYGYDRPTTPALERLAGDGVRYRRCYTTATWTKPASASVLSGTYPPTHGARTHEDRFDSDVPRLPALFEGETAGFSAMGNVSTDQGHARGFDVFRDRYREDSVVERRGAVDTPEGLHHESADAITLPRAEDVLDPAVEWLADREDGLAFCWLIDPHLPYTTPPDERALPLRGSGTDVDGSYDTLPEFPTPDDIARLRSLYDSEIRHADDRLGRALDRLRGVGVYEDTAVVVAGDHGEGFLNHDSLLHGDRPHRELARGPLVVKPPGTGQRGVVEGVVSLVDLLPTALSMAGADCPDAVAGEVLPPFGEPDPDRAVFTETEPWPDEPTYYSVRTGRWNYITVERPDDDGAGGAEGDGPGGRLQRLRHLLGRVPDPRYLPWAVRHPRYAVDELFGSEPADRQLFDVHADPAERTNRAGDEQAVVDRLQGALGEWLAGCRRRAPAGGGDGGVDPATAEQLRHLGYR